MSKRAFLLLSSFLFLLASCSSPTPAPAATDTATPLTVLAVDTVTPLPSETPSAIPVPGPTRPQYTMDVQFNYTNKSALVNETIIYTNNSTDTLTSLVLAIEPTCTQSFSLNTLSVDQLPITNYIFDPENIQAAHHVAPTERTSDGSN
jgi:hypothetical protein